MVDLDDQTEEEEEGVDEFQLLISAVALAAAVARADGEIHPSEFNLITDVLCQKFGLMSSAAPSMASAGLEKEISEDDILANCDVFYENSNDEDRKGFMEILIGIADADLHLLSEEFKCLKLIAGGLDIDIETMIDQSRVESKD